MYLFAIFFLLSFVSLYIPKCNFRSMEFSSSNSVHADVFIFVYYFVCECVLFRSSAKHSGDNTNKIILSNQLIRQPDFFFFASCCCCCCAVDQRLFVKESCFRLFAHTQIHMFIVLLVRAISNAEKNSILNVSGLQARTIIKSSKLFCRLKEFFFIISHSFVYLSYYYFVNVILLLVQSSVQCNSFVLFGFVYNFLFYLFSTSCLTEWNLIERTCIFNTSFISQTMVLFLVVVVVVVVTYV